MSNNFLDFVIRIKSEGAEAFKTIGVDANSLKEGVKAVKGETDKLNSSMINLGQMSQMFDGVRSMVNMVQNTFKDLTTAYQGQIVAETQLQTVMKQRMNATTEDINSIKELCSAQQKLGVIGDEVALSGAQQIATFVNSKSSLTSLIPAMNNLLAQQKGLNATQGDAVSIGNMMGKAMQGSVDVLQRVGITFTDAQKQVIQYGTESERAAMLAQVITDNVGDMNAQLAATDAGKQKQLENTLGDIKEQFGGIVQSMGPTITLMAAFTNASTGMVQMAAYMRALTATTIAHTIAVKAVSVATTVWTAVQAAFNAVMALNPIALVVIAIAALVAAVIYCYKQFDGFRKVCNQVWEGIKTVAKWVWDLNMKFNPLLVALKAVWNLMKKVFGNHDDEVSGTVDKVNSKLDEQNKKLEKNAQTKKRTVYVGQLSYQDQAAYYDREIAKHEDVIRHLKSDNEEELKAEKDKLRKLQAQKDAVAKKMNWKPATGKISSAKEEKAQAGSIGYIDDRISVIQKKIKLAVDDKSRMELQQELDKLTKEKHTIEMSLQTKYEPAGIDKIQTYTQLEKELNYYQDKLKDATATERIEIQKQINSLNKLNDAWKEQIDGLNAPGDISALNTYKELGDAISYYQAQQKKQSAAEIADTQRTIDALTRKKDMLDSITELPSMQDETAKLDGLTGKKLNVELNLLGLDDIRSKIKKLQSMLADTNVDSGQKKQIQGLLSSYTKYEKVLRKSNVSFGDMWGTTKGLGGTIEGLTSTIEGNGNAWQKISGIIDGIFGLYEGFNSVIEIINLLTGASIGHAAAKGVEATAETTEATVSAASAAAAVTASVATTTALSAETGAWSALAAAKTFAAHAYLPFVGTGIAAGFVAMQQSIIAACAIPKFANGGLAYGPTLGLFGEYAGASNNPEVVAPLNKLRSLIQPVGYGFGGKVEFDIKGRALKGVLVRQNNLSSRS